MISEKEIILRTIKSWKRQYPFLKTFNNLTFVKHHLNKISKTPHLHASVRIDEEWFSVLIGDNFYSNGNDTYEIFSSKMQDPIGYIEKHEVTFEYVIFQIDNPKFLILEKTSIPNLQILIENNKKKYI